jgi:hypothetical protein
LNNGKHGLLDWKTVPKWVLIVLPKIPQMPQNISAQNVCPSPKVQDFWKKALSGSVGSPKVNVVLQKSMSRFSLYRYVCKKDKKCLSRSLESQYGLCNLHKNSKHTPKIITADYQSSWFEILEILQRVPSSVSNWTGQCNFSGQRDRNSFLVPGQK